MNYHLILPWSVSRKRMRGGKKGLFVLQKDVDGVGQRFAAWEDEEDDGGVDIYP